MKSPGIFLLVLSVTVAFTADICFSQDPAEHEDEEFPVEEIEPACVMVVTSTGNGSGFFVTPNGHMVTSFHVIADEKKPYIKTSDGRKHRITHALTYSIKNDLVLLATSARNTPFLQIGDPRKIKLNMSICTIGHPHGLEWTFTKGYIAGYRHQASRNRNEIQFSADVSPGSSGGPVVGTDGKVYGVVTLLEIRMLAVRESTLILDPSEVLKFGISADTLNTMMYSRKYPISLANLADLKKRIELTNDLNFLS